MMRHLKLCYSNGESIVYYFPSVNGYFHQAVNVFYIQKLAIIWWVCIECSMVIVVMTI